MTLNRWKISGCVTDDLTGWFETVERRRLRQKAFGRFRHYSEEAENMIMAARVEAGWITQKSWTSNAPKKRRARQKKRRQRRQKKPGR